MSSFSQREKLRRNPCQRRNNRSLAWRRWSGSRSYSPGAPRRPPGFVPPRRGPWPGLGACGGAVPEQRGAGVPRAQAMQQLAPFRRVVGRARRERERPGGPRIRGHQMQLGGPATAGPAEGWVTVLLERPRPGGRHLPEGAVQRQGLQLDLHEPLALQLLEDPGERPVLRPAVPAGGAGVPVAEPRRQPAP